MKTEEGISRNRQEIRDWISRRMGNGLEFPVDLLPETGLTVTGEGGKRLCAVVVYFEKTSPVAYIGWIATNPCNTLEESANSIAFGIREAVDYARRNGARHLLTTTGNRGINRIFDRQGFVSGDRMVEHKYRYLF
ncbi:MAG: hypothetical protein V8T90_13310 [Victivallales bacterium]